MFCAVNGNPSTMELARNQLEQTKDPSSLSCSIITTSPKSITFHQSRTLIGASFGGEKSASSGEHSMLWAMKPFSNIESDDNTMERVDVSQFVMGFPIHHMLNKGGLIFGVQDQEKNGALHAAVVMREYDASKEKTSILTKMSDFLTNFGAFIRMWREPGFSMPALMKNNSEGFKLFMQRGEYMEKKLGEWHRTYGPKGLHWYIGQVAVDPGSQGKGYGRDIMMALSQAADTCNMECYLECSKKNRPFYEKFDFDVVREVLLIAPDDSSDELAGYLMTRRPVSVHA